MRAETGQNDGNTAIGIDIHRRTALAANEVVKQLDKLSFTNL